MPGFYQFILFIHSQHFGFCSLFLLKKKNQGTQRREHWHNTFEQPAHFSPSPSMPLFHIQHLFCSVLVSVDLNMKNIRKSLYFKMLTIAAVFQFQRVLVFSNNFFKFSLVLIFKKLIIEVHEVTNWIGLLTVFIWNDSLKVSYLQSTYIINIVYCAPTAILTVGL